MPQRLFRDVLASLRADADILLILLLRIREVISPEILTLSQVPNVKTLCFMFSQNLSKRTRNGGSMYFKTVSF